MQKDLTRLFRHTGIYLIGDVLNRLGAFILLPLYTSYLDPAQYGVLEILYSTTSILSVLFGAGLSHATMRFYFEYKDQSDRNTVVTTNFVVSFLLVLSGVSCAAFFSHEITILVFDGLDNLASFQLALVIIVLELTNEVFFAYVRAREKSMFFVSLSLLRFVVQVSLSIYLVKELNWGVLGILTANLASVASLWATLLVFTIFHCGIKIDPLKIKPILQYSIPFAMSMVVGVVLNTADRFIIKTYTGFSSVGLYGLAVKFSLLLRFLLSQPFERSYGPYRFSILDGEDAPSIYAIVPQYLTGAAVLIALGISLFTPDVLHLMSAPEFWPAGDVVPILLIGVIASSLSYCFQTGILISKQTKYVFYIALVSVTLNLIFNLTLIPFIGVYGAAWASSFTSVFTAGMTYYISQRLYPVPYQISNMIRLFFIGLLIYTLSRGFSDLPVLFSILVKMGFVLIFLVAIYFVDSNIRAGIKSAQKRLMVKASVS